VNTLNTAFLISSIAFAVNSYAQDATDNSNAARQTPTIEDQLAQLQQDQQGLAGHVDALNSYRGFVVSSQENVDVISRTKNVTNVFYDKTGVIDNGPDYDRLTQDSNVRIDRSKLNFVQQNNPETTRSVAGWSKDL
jgi:hypothetical protein